MYMHLLCSAIFVRCLIMCFNGVWSYKQHIIFDDISIGSEICESSAHLKSRISNSV